MRFTYRVLAYLVAVGVAVQAAAIALGFFTIVHEVEDGAVVTSDYEFESNLGLVTHGMVGLMVIPAIALALLVLSFFTRAPGAVRWAATVFGLVVLQVTLGFVAFGALPAGALHGLNALLLFTAAAWAGRRITRVTADEKALEAAAV